MYSINNTISTNTLITNIVNNINNNTQQKCNVAEAILYASNHNYIGGHADVHQMQTDFVSTVVFMKNIYKTRKLEIYKVATAHKKLYPRLTLYIGHADRYLFIVLLYI